jgi:hypothetical protein
MIIFNNAVSVCTGKWNGEIKKQKEEKKFNYNYSNLWINNNFMKQGRQIINGNLIYDFLIAYLCMQFFWNKNCAPHEKKWA